MNPQEYDAFTTALTQSLEGDPRILGLMAAGSMARQSHQPDQWSDHDFWVIAQPEAVEWYRHHPDWLPTPERIVLHFVDPMHNGVTAIYASGHLAEFAVSDRAGLQHAKVNDYRLLFDRDGLAADITGLQQTTAEEFERGTQDDRYLVGRILTELLIGIGRYRRGEHLSARQFISGWALYPLLRLIAKHIPAAHNALDNLDPLRRFESAYPALSAEIADLLRRDLDQVALGILDLIDQHLRDQLADYPAEAVHAVRQRILTSAANQQIP